VIFSEQRDPQVRAIIRRIISFAVYAAITISASYGLALLSKWIWLPSGSSLSKSQARDAMDFALTFGIAFSLGEQLRPRPKPKE
jgi:hypothetical protein